ncbi:MAG: tRNA (adenosine(37)-N6)-threonylcarbamoyltransferase complex dimerization subunit type 1 TsaB [Bacteroidales bacterium]|nr:tRNA (adenosine(37)-N6)-threonylcarbamoyltransferase complex dimerization subunit type 1 TsaB [Bacteroidales bacterium]
MAKNSAILVLETTTEICSVAIGKDGQCVSCVENDNKNSHAEKVIDLIQQALNGANISLNDLSAIAVSQGPGSYTGLRIGTSTCKGLCYALQIPLIAADTLLGIATAAKIQYPDTQLFISMLDAKRMEVYTTVFDQNLQKKEDVTNVILSDDTYLQLLNNQKVVFCGNANTKVRPLYEKHQNAFFCDAPISARNLLQSVHNQYVSKDFADVAYFEPFYLKAFRAGVPKVKGLN